MSEPTTFDENGLSPHCPWRKSRSALRRAVMAFADGFVLLIGARLAGGCTSGHGISGIAQFAVSSMIAVAAMFAGGIVTALLFRKV